MINPQQRLICGAKHSFQQMQILFVDHRVYGAGWSGSLLPLTCVTRNTGHPVIAFGVTPPVLVILKAETTPHPQQMLFKVQEIMCN